MVKGPSPKRHGNGEIAPFPDLRRGLPLRSSPRSGPSDGERIVEDVPIANQETGEMSVELVDFGSARTILFSH
jgi:hypothetical protein